MLPRLQPDLVTMDVELPGMSGLEAVEEIMGSRPLPILVLSATSTSATTRRRRRWPAARSTPSPRTISTSTIRPERRRAAFRQRVKMLSRARVIRHPRARLAAVTNATGAARRASAIGVCASTGGPQMLMLLLTALPADYPSRCSSCSTSRPGSPKGWSDGWTARWR